MHSPAPERNARIQEYETLRFAGFCSTLPLGAEAKNTPTGGTALPLTPLKKSENSKLLGGEIGGTALDDVLNLLSNLSDEDQLEVLKSLRKLTQGARKRQ